MTRWALLAAAVVVAGGYLGLRAWLLGGVSVPPRPYVVPPAAADFLPYVLNKALYYLLAEFWLVPAVPIGGLAYFSGVPLVFYGFSLLTVVAVGVWVWRRRRELAVRLGVCWLLLAMAPVLPVFESPHHLYLPGVGWALLIASVLDRLAAIDPRRLRARLGGAAVVTAALLFALLTHFNSLAMEAADRLEDAVVADVIADAPDLRDGDTLYVANLPIIAHYVGLAVEQRTGVRDLRCVALTWAPRVLGVRTASECRRIDAHTLEFTLADDRYFSGPFGTLVAQANHGRHAAALLATPCARDGYRIELVAGDAAGIRALRVHFDRPWGAGRRLFYWGSAARWATRLEAADGE